MYRPMRKPNPVKAKPIHIRDPSELQVWYMLLGKGSGDEMT
jgi:hypothetical protein